MKLYTTPFVPCTYRSLELHLSGKADYFGYFNIYLSKVDIIELSYTAPKDSQSVLPDCIITNQNAWRMHHSEKVSPLER